METRNSQEKSLKELLNLSDEFDLQHERMMIHFRYMKQIEVLMEKSGGMTKKELAQRLQTSPSFITQLFNGDKILNFEILAKVQEVFQGTFKFDFEFEDEIIGEVAEERICQNVPSPREWHWPRSITQENGNLLVPMLPHSRNSTTTSDRATA